MKLLKRDRKKLERVLRLMQTGIGFIMNPNTALMIKTNMSSDDVFTASYHKDERYNKIAKEIGNDFVLAVTAMNELKQLLEEENETTRKALDS